MNPYISQPASRQPSSQQPASRPASQQPAANPNFSSILSFLSFFKVLKGFSIARELGTMFWSHVAILSKSCLFFAKTATPQYSALLEFPVCRLDPQILASCAVATLHHFFHAGLSIRLHNQNTSCFNCATRPLDIRMFGTEISKCPSCGVCGCLRRSVPLESGIYHKK